MHRFAVEQSSFPFCIFANVGRFVNIHECVSLRGKSFTGLWQPTGKIPGITKEVENTQSGQADLQKCTYSDYMVLRFVMEHQSASSSIHPG